MREDPLVDEQALAVQADDRVLAVASGGCTALTLLARGPRELVALDRNPAQLHLLELKLAAICELSLSESRRFLGAWPDDQRLRSYRQRLAARLSPAARAFWDAHPRLVNEGVLHAGATELLCRRWMPRLLFPWIHDRKLLDELLELDDLAAQRRLFETRWDSWRWRAALRLAFHPLLNRAVYGARFRERFGQRDLVAAFAERLERGFTAHPARTNYFLWQLLLGRYPPDEAGLPAYLREPTYGRIAAHADRLRLCCAPLDAHLEQVPAASYDKVTLSNAFEWFPEEQLVGVFSALARATSQGGRIVLRHLLAVTPLPAGLGLSEEESVSDELTKAERSFLYQRVSLYHRASRAGAEFAA